MRDGLLILQADKTAVTAGTTTGTGVNVGQTVRSEALYVRVDYYAAVMSSGTANLVFNVEESSDNSTWNLLASSGNIGLTTTAQKGPIWIPFNTTKRYIRLNAVVPANGSVTYGAGVTNSFV